MPSHITIDFDKCKDCSLCIDVCPSNLLKIGSKKNYRGYKVIELVGKEYCLGNSCLKCIELCPDNAIIKPDSQPDILSGIFYRIGSNISTILDKRKEKKK